MYNSNWCIAQVFPVPLIILQKGHAPVKRPHLLIQVQNYKVNFKWLHLDVHKRPITSHPLVVNGLIAKSLSFKGKMNDSVTIVLLAASIYVKASIKSTRSLFYHATPFITVFWNLLVLYDSYYL